MGLSSLVALALALVVPVATILLVNRRQVPTARAMLRRKA